MASSCQWQSLATITPAVTAVGQASPMGWTGSSLPSTTKDDPMSAVPIVESRLRVELRGTFMFCFFGGFIGLHAWHQACSLL